MIRSLLATVTAFATFSLVSGYLAIDVVRSESGTLATVTGAGASSLPHATTARSVADAMHITASRVDSVEFRIGAWVNVEEIGRQSASDTVRSENM